MRRDETGFWQTWVVSAGMRHQRQLTDEDANSGWPAWAPTGHRLAIGSDRADPDPQDATPVNDVFVLKADGSGLRKVTDSVGVSGDPGWSSDGSLLAYQADRGDYPGRQGIYVSRRRRNPAAPHHRVAARRWSRRGCPLLTRWTEPRLHAVPRRRPSRRRVRRVHGPSRRTPRATSDPFALHAGDAPWSPDGRRLVLETYPTPTSRGDVYTVDRDGSTCSSPRPPPVASRSADSPP
jgi:Tol biopolymer transport system component